MHDHQGNCRYMKLSRNSSLEELAAFHGHLGPYIVLGYRIGKYARESFCDDPFLLNARVFCSGHPPESCLVDGVQIGSGCTLGKCNISVEPSHEIRCEFVAEGRTLVIIPTTGASLPKGTHDEAEIEKFAEELFHRNDDELFSASIR